MSQETKQASLLIVDDTPTNIDVLVGLLSPKYRTRIANSGKVALSLCEKELPDLILLDIMMPEMDGYEVCERLKSMDETKNIPIIFITAKGEVEDETKGLSLGAVDYISKPITPAIVLARVETHLEIDRQRLKIEKAYNQLQELEALRDNLVHMVIHDMRNPLTLINGHLDMLKMRTNLEGHALRHVNSITSSCVGLIEMVSTLLDVSRFDNNEMPVQMDMHDLVQVTRDSIAPFEAIQESADIVFNSSVKELRAKFDKSLIERVITNLMGNAVKFTPKTGTVEVKLESANGAVKIAISDNGPGIAPEYHEKIFEKFGQVEMYNEKRKYSTGFGLTFCKLAVEAHGGGIGVESVVEEGSTFWFSLPAAQ